MDEDKILCKKCGQWKDNNDFYRYKGRIDKPCKACRRAYAAAWRTTHPNYEEKRRAYHRKYRKAHRGAHYKNARRWRKANLDKAHDSSRRWREANPDKCRQQILRYYARKKNAFVEDVDREEVFSRDKGKCHICKKKVDPKNWHLDHLLPLSRGGEHSYRNVALTHPMCNMRKHTGCLPSQLRLFG